MREEDYSKYLWRFRTFKDIVGNNHQKEILFAHHAINKEQIALYPKLVEHERGYHRRAVSEKLAQAIYNGWFPYDVEWWEGEYDDDWNLVEYRESPLLVPRTDVYHFYTKIYLAAPYYTPQLVRGRNDRYPTIETYTPERLED